MQLSCAGQLRRHAGGCQALGRQRGEQQERSQKVGLLPLLEHQAILQQVCGSSLGSHVAMKQYLPVLLSADKTPLHLVLKTCQYSLCQQVCCCLPDMTLCRQQNSNCWQASSGYSMLSLPVLRPETSLHECAEDATLSRILMRARYKSSLKLATDVCEKALHA